MKVTQEKLPDSQIGLEIEIPGELSQQVYDQTLSKLSREVSLPGFRKGKIPRHILVQRLGVSRIKATAIDDLIQKAIDQAIAQEKIEALGNYQLKSSFEDLIGHFEPGHALTFSASVDVPPTPFLKQYKGLSVQAEEVVYDAGKVEEVLAENQKRLAILVPVEDRPAQAEDVAIVDFVGHLALPEDAEAGTEPEAIPGGSAEDFQIELGEGRFIPGFIEGIIGMTPGETRVVEATFPEEYPQKEVAGQQASFKITLKELKARELPELDDDFAQEVSDFETLQALRESLEKRYREEAEGKTKQNKHRALCQALVEHIEVELPETLVQQESRNLLQQTLRRLAEQGIDVNKVFNRELGEQFLKQSRPEAVMRLKQTLALGEVAKAEAIAPTPEAVDAKVQEVLENTTQDRNDIDLSRLRDVVEEELLKDAILDWLELNGSVELVPEGSLSPEDSSNDNEDEDSPNEDSVASEAASPGIEPDTEVAVPETPEVEDNLDRPTEAPSDAPKTKPDKKKAAKKKSKSSGS